MSETPQTNPEQGPVPTGPTQPLPQGTPGWGPAAQPPGQLPPIPAQPPGAPSAWSQTLPLGGAPTAGRPHGSARSWLIGGGVVLAVGAIVGVVLAVSGSDGPPAASGNPPGAAGGAAKPAAPEQAPAGKAFTKVPEGCELIKASTIARVAPGTECEPSQFDKATMAAMITRMPSWRNPSGSGGAYVSLNVNLTVGPSAASMYDMHKTSAHTALKKVRTVTDSRSLNDLGEESHLVHAVDKDSMPLAEAKVIVRDGNAEFTVGFTYSPSDSGKSEKQAEDDAIAVARDVLGSLR
ncbi:hypothetical protein ABCR94_12685 [Streptomyces sp. 21So2-11]|uniref:hypothetical protein n=1 Tax=Streptomyces sp. 21So2-11 TaxID=3144408 RepID=UPI003219BB26